MCDFFFFLAELQKIRQKVVSEIKSTKQLEDDLDQMDIKIGLLIKNRVTLQVHYKTFSTWNCVLTILEYV